MFTRGYWHWLYWLVNASKGRIMKKSAFCCPSGDSSGGHPRFCCAAQTRFWPERLEVHKMAPQKNIIVHDLCCIMLHLMSPNMSCRHLHHSGHVFQQCCIAFLSFNFSFLALVNHVFAMALWPYGHLWPFSILFLAISEFLLFLALWCLFDVLQQ